ncbi:MAG: asparagine synthase (glutamine-hydrolyzing), partial [Candidatus Cloacimonadota bacterium]|nr:asparagine synthase (glutamine-hydrolyzing) [Candidatus Cloacimonadota bacterium]
MLDMLDIIEHRGPDDSNIFIHKNCTFGHRRLSIIDTQGGQQPIFNEDKTVCVIFNGEIYNYKYFKKILQVKGHKFSTKTDTEILVHCYEEFGLDFIKDLNGIFGFAIYDLIKEKIILARDHFGVKPLHYYFKDGILIFGSEQKSIILHPKVERKLNLQALHLHLNLRYTQGEDTLFEGIKRLAPAHFLIFDKNGISIKKYWELPKNKTKITSDFEIKDRINFLLTQAIKRQLMSDVPIGVYLSGGMDSSTIVQRMSELGVNKINTFTLGFNEPTDEFVDAQIIAEKFSTNHHTLNLSLNPIQQFANVIRFAEEPKINLLQGFNLSIFVQPHVKVVLGG